MAKLNVLILCLFSFFLLFGHYLFCFVFPTLGLRVISGWD